MRARDSELLQHLLDPSSFLALLEHQGLVELDLTAVRFRAFFGLFRGASRKVSLNMSGTAEDDVILVALGLHPRRKCGLDRLRTRNDDLPLFELELFGRCVLIIFARL